MAEAHTPIRELIAVLIKSASDLLQAEIGLFGTEMQGKLVQGRAPLIWIATAGGLFLLGGFALVAAAVLWLVSLHVEPYLAALAVAIVIVAFGLAFLMSGLARLRKFNATPSRTLAQLRADAALFTRGGANG